MMRRCALVTGATGFVGARVVRQLAAEGWIVHILSRQESATDELMRSEGGLEIHRWEGEFNSLQKIVKRSAPDVVFHLASVFLTRHEPVDVSRVIQSNVLFGSQLAEAMTIEGVRYLVNTGTSWQHFGNCSYSPVNLYAATKQAYEDILQYYVEAHGLAVVTLTLFDTYGPSDQRRKLIGILLEAVRSNSAVALSQGEQLLDLVHVEDVARAYAIAGEMLLAGSCRGHERYCVSSGEALSIRNLVEEIEVALGTKVPVQWGGRPYRDREVMSPWRPCVRLPGWNPRISLRKGLEGLKADVGA